MDKPPQTKNRKAYFFLKRGMVFIWDSGGKASIMDMAIINQKEFSMMVILIRERCMVLVV